MGAKITIVGLGYVGLPLAVEFGKKYSTIGFDVDNKRIDELKLGFDNTAEVSKRKISSSIKLKFSSSIKDISNSNIYIIAVPTPIDNHNNPDLSILFSASKMVGSVLKKDDIVIYESTVYPGCTEEDCVPILEKESNLVYNEDFFCGYSPERINPGDKERTVTNILKITSGSNPEISDKVDKLYKSIIKAGTHKAESIKVAEAAKIIENCQRDINIAFINELSILFDKMNINTYEVLSAAETKWNFLPFKPGLVGGHCIGVDPFYLTYKAKQLGYDSKIILSGRNLNNFMSQEIANRILSKLNLKNNLNGLILGATFKEDCPDIRNSKVFDVYSYLNKDNISIDMYDPYASKEEVDLHYGVKLKDFSDIKINFYDFVVIAVPHFKFKNLDIDAFCKTENSIVFDVKNIYNNNKYLTL
tara:strand:+ start:1334 stop:2584 length:1251 start_codon:yes stop_codon:yes gene_type:complete